MAAINFPAASESPWYNSETGTTYKYENGGWRALSTVADQFDGIYVRLTGDTMTGSLALNDKITLDATDGDAEFVGEVVVGTNFSTYTGDVNAAFTYSNSGGYYANSNSSTETFRLTAATGNATFAGQLSASVSPANAAEPGLIVLGPEQGSNSGSVYIGGVASRKIELNASNGSATFAGAVDVTGLAVDGPQTSNIVAVAALDIDCGLGNYFTKTISGNSAFTFSNAPSGKSFAFTLEVTHTGGTITWPAAVKWPANTAPTLTTGNTHLFVFVTDDGGSRWRGAAIADYVN